ncbi:MAG: PAS domain-containing sensor histidine kinase [Dehalococcoidales bacterium]|nr:PAS domain-containing sensor histidine kinase [Dehalococcoidales bacterium]
MNESDNKTIKTKRSKKLESLLDIGEQALNFSNAMDYLPQGIRIIDTHHRVRYINPAFARLSGIARKDAIGELCYEMFPSPYCHTENCSMARIKQGEKQIQSEINRERKDGLTVPCVVTAFPLKAPDKSLIGIMESFRDTSARRKLEARAEEAEDRYRTIVELTGEVGEGILMLQDIDGREGVIIFASPLITHMTGYSNSELLGMSFFELMEHDDAKAYLARHRRRMKGKRLSGLYEATIVKGKAPMRIELTSAITIHRGQVTNVVFVRDITEKKKYENILRLSERRYRGLFKNAPIGIMELDYSEVKKYIDRLYANGVKDLSRYFAEEPQAINDCINLIKSTIANNSCLSLLQANSLTQFRSHLRRSHYKNGNAVKESFLGLSRGYKNFSYDEEMTDVKGKQRYLRVQISLAPGYENTWGLAYVCFLDLTELIQSQRDLELYKEHLEEAVKERTALLSKEVERSKSMEAKISKLYKKEQQLRKELEDQINTRIQFTHAVIHELKTPLTSMISSSDLLGEEIAAIAPQQRLANNIKNSAFDLNNRVDELLDVAKGEIGMLKISLEPIDPRAVFLKAIDEMASYAIASDQNIEVSVDEILPRIMADRVRLKEIFINLLSNAIKYNRVNGNILAKSYKQGNTLVFMIKDEGPGISRKDRQILFKPYQRLGNTEGNLSGLGLGLAISKTLIGLHKGKIWLRSRKGKGASFYISIPTIQG